MNGNIGEIVKPKKIVCPKELVQIGSSKVGMVRKANVLHHRKLMNGVGQIIRIAGADGVK